MEVKPETKIERVILRHLTGSKANQEEKFALSQFTEITIGRNPSCLIRFDADLDDLVSGQHARITQDAGEPTLFTLTDPGSRNGTFVNKQRVTTPVRIMPGDVIQFGAGGPEMEFDCDPRPDKLIKKTRAAAGSSLPLTGSAAIPATRTGPLSGKLSASVSFNEHSGDSKGTHAPVGKATFERVISQQQQQTRKQLLYGVVAIALLVGVAAWVMRPRPCTDCPLSPGQIAEMNRNAVVRIDLSWKLINTRTGGSVNHAYTGNSWKDVKGEEHRIVNDNRQSVAVYVVLDDGAYEPWLTDNAKGSIPIGGSGSGTGFAMSSDGFILTARHVGAGWMTKYQYPDSAYPGVVYVPGPGGRFVMRTNPDGSPMLVNPAWSWVPGNTRQYGSQGARWAVEGRHDYLNVTFPLNKTPIPAKVARISDRHDVTMLKIDMPGAVTKCELSDSYDSIKVGDTIAVLGYPSVSPITWGRISSQDPFNTQAQDKIIPDPSLTTGNIGRVLRGKQADAENRDGVTSDIGDAYQVTANPGAGNSGGPVFDDRGRVIGIYFAGAQKGGGQVSFAVPIRYALELMTTTPK